MNNRFGYLTIKFLDLFRFNKMLEFNFKKIVKFFSQFFTNKTIFSSINIG